MRVRACVRACMRVCESLTLTDGVIVYVSCLPPSDRTTYGVMTEWAKREPSPEVSTSSSNRFPPLNLSRSFDAPPAENHRLRSSRHSQYMGSESARDLDLGGVTTHGHRPSRSREIPSLVLVLKLFFIYK